MNRQTILLASFIFACFICFTSCDGGLLVTGRVLDEQGKPINGAKVTLISRGKKNESSSRADGSYNVGIIHAPRAPTGSLTVSKEGYETYNLPFSSFEEIGHKRDVVLKASVSSKVEPN